VDPPAAPIKREGNVYTLLDDIYGSIVIERDSIIINGATYTIYGNGSGTGVDLSGRYNVTVKNLGIINFNSGIYLKTTHASELSNLTVKNNHYGVFLLFSDNNLLLDNKVVNNSGYGILLYMSRLNTLNRNKASYNEHGIFVICSTENLLTGNEMFNNTYNFGVDGSDLYYWMNSIGIDNTVNGKPVYYIVNVSNVEFGQETNAGTFYLINCDNVTVKDLNLAANYYGLISVFCKNSRIWNITAELNVHGIELRESSNLSLERNNLNGNIYNFGVCGWSLSEYIHDIDETNKVNNKSIYYLINKCDEIFLDKDVGYFALINLTSVHVYGVNLSENQQGILFAYTNSSSINHANLLNNDIGIYLFKSFNNTVTINRIAHNERGIMIDSSRNNLILGNNIEENKYGILLFGSCNNTVAANNITMNTYGAYIYGLWGFPADDNQFFHNNFLFNTWQVDQCCYIPGEYYPINRWDNGYPSGGNYWSDYNGTDLFGGPYQNETGSDGIGDTPKDLFWENCDNYPLMQPWIATLINASVFSIPKTLNVHSTAKYVSIVVKSSEVFNVTEIIISTMKINGVVGPVSDVTFEDYNQDGLLDLRLKFKVHQLIEYILENYEWREAYSYPGQVTGMIDIQLTIYGFTQEGMIVNGTFTAKLIIPPLRYAKCFPR